MPDWRLLQVLELVNRDVVVEFRTTSDPQVSRTARFFLAGNFNLFCLMSDWRPLQFDVLELVHRDVIIEFRTTGDPQVSCTARFFLASNFCLFRYT